MKACCVYRATGHYSTHVSSCERPHGEEWTSESSWHKTWVADGTRSHWCTSLCEFRETGYHEFCHLPTPRLWSDTHSIWKAVSSRGDWGPDKTQVPGQGSAQYVPGLENIVSLSFDEGKLTQRRRRALRVYKFMSALRTWTEDEDAVPRDVRSSVLSHTVSERKAHVHTSTQRTLVSAGKVRLVCSWTRQRSDVFFSNESEAF